jgi:polar amino acid transport system substrate-binding protein
LSKRIRVPHAVAGGLLLVLTACGAPSGEPEAAAAQQNCTQSVPDSALVQPGKLNLGTNATLPPLSYLDEGGELMGQRVELGEELAARLCLEPVWTNAKATTMQPSLDAKRIDVVDIGFFVTEERTKVMRMIPTEQMGISISVSSGNPEGVSEEAHLSGKAVGVAAASFEERTVQELSARLVGEGLAPIDIRSFPEYDIVFQALSSGQIQAAATTSPVAKYYADRGGFAAAVQGLAPTPTALTIRGDNSALADAIITALDGMRADGSYAALMEKYALEPVEDFQVLYTG